MEKRSRGMKWFGLLVVVLLVGCVPGFPSDRSRVGSAISTQAQVAVPSWAKVSSVQWASLPKNIELDGSFNLNNKFISGGSLTVKVSGHNLVWSEGYYSDVQYILGELAKNPSGSTIEASKVWVKFNFRDSSGAVVTNPSWISLSQSQFASAQNIPARFSATESQTQYGAEQLNAVLVFACKQIAVSQSGTVEYDCNGADAKKVFVRGDNKLELGSGRGSWMLATVDGVGSSTPSDVPPPFNPSNPGGSPASESGAPPFTPGGLGSADPNAAGSTSGAPPFQPGSLGSTNPSSGTGSSTGSGSATPTNPQGTSYVPPLTNQAPPAACISPNNPTGCIN